MPTTLKDIAYMAKTSTASVSMVLNNKKNCRVNQATKERIRKIALELNYRPNLQARALSKGKTRVIGILLKCPLSDPWYCEILERLQVNLRKHNYNSNIYSCLPDSKSIGSGLEYLSQMNVDALVIGPLGFMEEYKLIARQLENFKHVVAYDVIENMPLDNVKINSYAAARLSCDYLVKKGHKKIGLVEMRPEFKLLLETKTRHSGYMDAIHEHGLPVVEEWNINIPKIDKINEEEFIALMHSKNRPTAFCCHNDITAACVMKILHKHGFSVPEDVSLIGMSDFKIAQYTTPTLTTASFNLDSYTNAICDMIISGIENNNKETEAISRYIEEPFIIERNSVKTL